MIYKRGKRWRVIVYAGRDPITGRKRQKSVSVDTRAEAKQVEARLITEVGAGQHRATSNRTVAELLDRWLEWRQSVRPIAHETRHGTLVASSSLTSEFLRPVCTRFYKSVPALEADICAWNDNPPTCGRRRPTRSSRSIALCQRRASGAGH